MVRRHISNINPKAGATQKVSLHAEGAYQKLLKNCQTGDAIFPLDAPGLPSFPPNSAFMSYLHALGHTEAKVVEEIEEVEPGVKQKVRKTVPSPELYELVQRALREPGFSLDVEIGPHREKTASFLPGHLWDLKAEVSGPRPADVMIINKMPWKFEINVQRGFSGEDGQILLDALARLKAKNCGKYYITHLVKFMPPNWKTNLRASWTKDCFPLLHQELKIVQPKFILCVGSDVSKGLLGSKASVTAMEGRVEDYRYNIGWFPNQDSEEYWKTAKVMTIVHPKQVIRDQSALRQLERGLGRFCSLVGGVEIGDSEVVDHRAIYDYDTLFDNLCEIETDPDKEDDVIAVDAEWHGEHPGNSGSYLRTVQLSWKPKHALGIVFNKQGGEENLVGEEREDVIDLLTVFFNGGEFGGQRFRRKRVVGHFFNADLEWLVDGLNMDIRKSFACRLYDFEVKPLDKAKNKKLTKLYLSEGFKVGDYVPAWYRTKFEGGADTGLMCHAAEETASYKLETLAMRYTSAPRYDSALDQWKVDYCKSLGIQSSDLGGYGECPDDVLLPYGMYDADVTLRLFYKFDVLIDEDYEGNCCREAFWESQIATPAVLEIHRTGITVDKDRIDILTNAFCDARNGLEQRLREKISWPDFNIRSTQHVKEFLYGHKLNGKLDKDTGKPVKLRPDGAISLNLMPICDTSKPPKQWIEVIKSGKTHEASPSTNKQVLSLLSQAAADSSEAYKSKYVDMVRDYRFLDQVLKTVLRPPMTDDATEEALRDDDGNMQYADGLASMCCEDGKVRTHIYQTKETGRWASARPNLQNISKQRDPDYKRLLKDTYKYSLRSVLKASPGHVLLEADYVGAELFGMAVMSTDKSMIEHAKRNQLAEDDPDFYDIHSNVAKLAFRLDCPPTKSGLESIGKKHIRIVAKSVVFGIAYGRGARAIATAAKEQGIDITVQEAQQVIDTIFAMYPMLKPFFQECKERATGIYIDPETQQQVTNNVICNCYGRFRRFPDAGNDNSLAAEFERQAMNFPIQSMIASAMSRAIAYLYDYKQRQLAKGHDMFKIVLQIHDAILFEVPYKYVKHVCEYVLPKYMRDSVPIYPTNLGGMPTNDGPYTLGIEADVMHHWGEALTYEEASNLKLPTGVGGATGCIVNYSKPPKVTEVVAAKRRK